MEHFTPGTFATGLLLYSLIWLIPMFSLLRWFLRKLTQAIS